MTAGALSSFPPPAAAGPTAGEHLAGPLLRVLVSDPTHLPERLALFAVAHLGPKAGGAVRRLRAERPEAGLAELRTLLIVRGTRRSMAEGAVVGGPFLVLIPVAFCAALLAQARMVLELAALEGRDPCALDRVGDLLVLQGAQPSTEQAMAAVAATGTRRTGPRLPRGGRVSLVLRMASLLGVVTPPGAPRGRLRACCSWLYVVLLVVLGFFLPLLWVPAMAASYRHATPLLGRRAVAYFAPGEPAAPAAWKPGRGLRITLPSLRTAVVLLALVAVAAGALLADIEIGGSAWATAGLAVVLLSQLIAGVWVLRRRSRRRG